MKINPEIFKSYDIRGIYPDELNEEVAFQIGCAIVKHIGAKNVVVGHDARLSSPSLLRAVTKSILSQGIKVYDIGMAPTECLYFSVGQYDFDAGIMVTASHNPKEYNGFKMLKKDENNIKVISGKELLLSISNDNDDFNPKGEIETVKKDIWKDYLSHIFSFVDLTQIEPFKIVVDASNGVAGIVIDKIREKLPVEIIPLNFEPSGDFPNHSPNPLSEGSMEQIKNKILEQKADFGFIFDGDGDRIFLVNELGELTRADATLLLLAKYFLEKNSGAAVVYNVICSKAVPEFIKKWGGVPVKTKVGFVNVREGLLKNNGIMGGEASGHYCFKDNYYMDSGLISFLSLLQIISKDNRSISEIIKELLPYEKSAELNFEVKNKEAILEKAKQKYADGKQDYLDGVTVEYKDWWFNMRPSNTEPLLRLTVEANTKELLKEKIKELTKIISK